jgi:hypothetical protein
LDCMGFYKSERIFSFLARRRKNTENDPTKCCKTRSKNVLKTDGKNIRN